MWETGYVGLTIHLPEAFTDEIEEVKKSDPGFLSRIVLYSLTGRSIWQHLRGQQLEMNLPDSTAIDIRVELPRDLIPRAEELQESQPGFFSKVVMYGLTRRGIYSYLREAIGSEGAHSR